MAKIIFKSAQQFALILLVLPQLFFHVSAGDKPTGQPVDQSIDKNKLTTEEKFPDDSFFSNNNSTYPEVVGQAFEAFDDNKNRVLCIYEFGLLCRALLQNAAGQPYPIEDARIDVREFRECWDRWITKILKPRSAFIAIDVQNDFISGTLATTKFGDHQDGSEIIEPINRLVDSVKFDRLYYSLDWHPENHISFLDNIRLRKLDNSSEIQNPDDAKVLDTVVFAPSASEKSPMRQRMWPRHCVQNSWGAELHQDLKVPTTRVLVYKGTDPEIDSYSALFDNGKLSQTTLVDDLKKSGITDCYFSGLAYDVCVGASAMDAVDLGYRTMIVDDASRGIVLKDVEKTKEKLREAYGLVVQTNEVQDMVLGKDRRPQLALKLALEIRKEGIVLKN